MALTLSQLIAPKTVAQMRQQVLDGLQGRGVVTKTGTGTGAVVLSGTPVGTYSVQVQISTAGEPGAAQFQYSLDGVTWSVAATTPTSGAVAIGTTGASVAFSAGPAGAGTSFALADLFAFNINATVFPVTSWQDGSTPRTLVEIDAAELADLTSLVAAYARGGYVTAQPGVTGASGSWLDLAGQNLYNLLRQPALATVGVVTLTDAANAGPFNISTGQIWVASTASISTTTPLRYLNATGGTLPQGGTLSIVVAAELPGSAYNVANSAITTLLTNLPGVTVTNTPGGGSWITTQGTNVESDLAYSTRCQGKWPSVGIGATAATFDYWCRTASAEVTRTKIAPSASQTNVSGSNASTSNILVSSSAGFIVGGVVIASVDSTYRMITAVPDGTHITVSPSFGAAPTTGTLTLASGGQVDVIVAGTSGAVSGGALSAVQAYIATRLPMGVTQNTVNATGLALTVAGTVYVYAAYLTSATAQIAANLQALQMSTPIGGTLYLSQVIEALNAPAGVRNTNSISTNGGFIDLVLSPTQVLSSLVNSLSFVSL